MRTRIAAAIMAALVALYLIFALRYGLILIAVHEPVAPHAVDAELGRVQPLAAHRLDWVAP